MFDGLETAFDSDGPHPSTLQGAQWGHRAIVVTPELIILIKKRKGLWPFLNINLNHPPSSLRSPESLGRLQ